MIRDKIFVACLSQGERNNKANIKMIPKERYLSMYSILNTDTLSEIRSSAKRKQSVNTLKANS